MYTRADLRSAVTGRIHNKIGVLPDPNDTINMAVRRVYSKVDLRSSKISETLVPDLIDTTYSYTCPTKLKGLKIIGLQPVTADRTTFDNWELVLEEEFDKRKADGDNIICIAEAAGVRSLKISTDLEAATDYNVVYYNKYPWCKPTSPVDPTLIYLLDSTADTDTLICDEEEFDLFVEKTVELMSLELRETEDAAAAKSNFKDLVREYQGRYKSEALPLNSTYYYV